MTRIRTLLALLASLVLIVAAAPMAVADEDPGDAEAVAEAAEDGEDLGRGAELKIQLLAAEFADGVGAAETVEADLASLIEAGVGFGDAFRIQLFLKVAGLDDLDEFLAAAWDEEAGEYDFGWGELKKSLTAEQLELLESLPKNLGQIVSADKRGHGRPDHAASFGEDKGKPESPGKDRTDKPGKGGRSGDG